VERGSNIKKSEIEKEVFALRIYFGDKMWDEEQYWNCCRKLIKTKLYFKCWMNSATSITSSSFAAAQVILLIMEAVYECGLYIRIIHQPYQNISSKTLKTRVNTLEIYIRIIHQPYQNISSQTLKTRVNTLENQGYASLRKNCQRQDN